MKDSQVMKPVLKLSEIEEGKAKTVEVDGRCIAIFKVKGNEVYAVDNMCPHQGGPLSEGHVEGYEVICPWHAWGFDIRSGACETVPQDRIRSYPVKVEGDDILLNI